MSERRACHVIGLSRSLFRYQSRKQEDLSLVKSISEIKTEHPYYGLPRVHAVLRRRGFVVNNKRVYRILRTLNLMVPPKKRRLKLVLPPTQKIPQATVRGDVWAMDFVSDRLSDGSSFRCLTVIDTLTRETPGIFASKSMAEFAPVAFMEQLKGRTQLPKNLILDNGSEFANRVFMAWCLNNNIHVHFIDPGKPVQNAYVESFNGKFRQEFLSRRKFKNVFEVKEKLQSWIKYYNEERPHSSLDYLTPKEFADQEIGVLTTAKGTDKNLLVLKTG